jgi:hypothetical protein
LGEADDLSDDGDRPDGGDRREPIAGGGRVVPRGRAAPAAGDSHRAPAARHAPRLSYEAVVRLHCDGRRGIHTGFVRDISRGGMFLRLVDPEPPGKRLGFELFLPGWRVPARGVAEVAWQRPRYEGPGRPPGMALRFVALEPVAIEMLSQVLPAGEAPTVEVLRPRPLPVCAPEPAPMEDAEAALGGAAALSLEALIAEAGIAPSPPSAPTSATPVGDDEVADLAEIFVPPPPLPIPVLPDVAPAAGSVPMLHDATPAQRLRWGSAAAGIAAVAGLATLVVVGAARREVVIVPIQQHVAPPATSSSTAGTPAARLDDPGAPPAPVSAVAAPPEPAPPQVMLASVPAPAEETAALATPSATNAAPRRLVSLRWEPLAAGGTRLVVTFDRELGSGSVRASRIGGEAPRLVVRLLGVGEGAPRAPWAPDTGEVRRVRAGRHDGEGGAELHLVLDLAGPAVRLAGSEVAGSELRLDLVQGP